MKTTTAAPCFVAILALGAAAPPQGTAPTQAVTLTSEPHHHLTLENDYVRVFRVEIGPRETTLLHQHDRDYVYVVLDDAEATNSVEGKPEAHLKLKDGDVRFSRGGFAHRLTNEEAHPFRNVTIELLRPQGEVHNLCQEVIAGQAGACTPTAEPGPNGAPGHTDRPLFATDETRVFVTEVAPRAGVYFRHGRWEELIVALDDVEMAAGKTEVVKLHHGDTAWVSPDSVRALTNPSKSPARFVTLEFQPAGRDWLWAHVGCDAAKPHAKREGRGQRALSAAPPLRFPQNVGEGAPADGDAGLDAAGDADARALARHAVARTQHPDAAAAVVHLKGAFAECAEGIGHLAGDGDVPAGIAAGVAVDVPNPSGLAACQENQKNTE